MRRAQTPPSDPGIPDRPSTDRVQVVAPVATLDEALADVRQRVRHRIETVEADTALRGLEDPPAVVVLDAPRERELFRALRARCPDTQIVVVADSAAPAEVVQWMRAGAWDYLVQPLDAARLAAALDGAIERHRCYAAAHVASDRGESELEGIVARSPKMKRALGIVRSVAPSSSTVLIQAESGTGKELIARAIHAASPRAHGPFVPVDCGALPEALVEGELFGHERGAFTGADRATPGLFRSANGGTLFLDEVGELPLAAQAKLLRALQQREVRPLGSSASHAVDVRILAATNRDLQAEVQERRFRADLYYRLRVVALPLPPLRERREDVVPLARHFVERFGAGRVLGIEPDALDLLLAQRWEGNVRELEHTLEAAVALARGPFLRATDLGLPAVAPGGAAPDVDPPGAIPLALDAYESACIRAALAQAAGDVRRAAGLLGIGRSTLYRKMVRHGLSA